MFYRSLKCEEIEFLDDSMAFLIINSNVKHDLGGTNEYAKRKADCEAVVKILEMRALRDASMNDIDGEIFFNTIFYGIISLEYILIHFLEQYEW